MSGGGVGATSLSCVPQHTLLKFVHHTLDGMYGGAGASHTLCQDCPLDKFWLAGQEVCSIAQDLAAGRLTKEEAMLSLSVLGPEVAGNVYEVISARRAEVREALVREALQDTPHLTDFDWNVKLAVSSDKILDLSQPLVTLHLHTSRGTTEDLSAEMTSVELDSLLDQLREAQKGLARLSHL